MILGQEPRITERLAATSVAPQLTSIISTTVSMSTQNSLHCLAHADIALTITYPVKDRTGIQSIGCVSAGLIEFMLKVTINSISVMLGFLPDRWIEKRRMR